MSGTYTPNVSRISALLQALRRVPFVIADTFSMGDFNPEVNWNGMAATDVKVCRARYLKIWSFLWISVDIYATVAAPFTNFITITIPGTIAGDVACNQSFGARVSNNSTNDPGILIGNGTQNFMVFLRPLAANFSAGQARCTANGFLEIEVNG